MARQRPRQRQTVRWTLLLAGLVMLLVAGADGAAAQRRTRATTIPLPEPQSIDPVAPAPPGSIAPGSGTPRESVQADISTRNVPVTSNFSGTEIVVFGAVANSRQASAEAGLYDIVIVVVGTPTKLTARKKDNVALIWRNTDAIAFDSVPSYYAIASTRPIDEIASAEVLKSTGIGFDYIPMELAPTAAKRSAAEIRQFRDAIVRLKRRERLYIQSEYAVAFIGSSLFRAKIDMPANVVVGPFETRVFLFRNGELLSQVKARLELERQGLEEVVHILAFQQPYIYALLIIFMATGAGLLATALFRGLGR